MGEITKHRLEDSFHLRARIGWQGLRFEEFTNEGPYLVTGTDFVNGRVNWDTCYHVSESRFRQDLGIQLRENDLLITKDGTVGKTAFVIDCPEKAALNSHIFLVRATTGSIAPVYLYYVLNSHQFNLFLANSLTGTTIKGLTQENFYKFSFDAPDIESQRKIADVLIAVDDVIDKTQSMIKKCTNLKQGIMNDLLSGRVRLNGFTGEWKTGKLGDIGPVCMCKRIFKNQTLLRGEVPFYKIGTFGGVADAYISKDLFEQYRKRFSYPKQGDVLISAAGTIGRVVVYNGEIAYYQDSNIVWLDNNETKVLNQYLFQYLAIAKWAVPEGSTIPRLYNSNIRATAIAYPVDLKEQQSIVDVLNAADERLIDERERLRKLEDIKRGLMDDLLTNRVSTNKLQGGV